MDRTYTRFEAGERHYPPLPASLRVQLDQIVPSVCGDLRYFPCSVRLKDGRAIDRVYVVEAQRYIALWGVWPDQDSGKSEVRIQEVEEIFESPSRLPAEFANEIYSSGESGMGYVVFTVKFADGTEETYVGGGAIDFLSIPAGHTSRDIVAVIAHKGRGRSARRSEPYHWCLHGHGKPHGA